MDLRGVVQGIQAGYPIMIRQHSGHIVTQLPWPSSPLWPGELRRHQVIRTPILTGGPCGRIQLADVSDEELLRKFCKPTRPMAPEIFPSALFMPCCWRRDHCGAGVVEHCGTWSACRARWRRGPQNKAAQAHTRA
jgi:hypothetical protein